MIVAKLNNKKAFTLIELLAIIVILAIIAVVTVPIILNIIDNSKKGAAIDSAYGYKDAVQKFYVSESIGDNGLKLDGIYSVQDGVLMGNFITTEISVSGSKPSKGYLEYSNNNLVSSCLVIDDYEIVYQNGDYTVQGKGKCSVVNVDFANDSWETVKTNLAKDRESYNDDLMAGSTKDVWVDLDADGDEEDSELFAVRLSNTSTPSECFQDNFSQSACGVVIEFVDIISKHVFNKGKNDSSYTNEGGWPATDTTDSIYTYINGDGNSIYNLIEDDVRNLIIPTKTISGHGNQTGAINYVSIDKLYLLATAEVWAQGTSNIINNDSGRVDENNNPITRQLDYYEKKGVTTNNYNFAIKKYNGTSLAWLLRSPCSDDISRFIYVASYGRNLYNINSNYSIGVAPAFRIL